MPVYRLPSGQFIVQPRILVRTENIERGIVKVVDGSLSFQDSPKEIGASANTRKTISVEQGMEALRIHSAATATALEDFLTLASDRGIYLDAAATRLAIRWAGPEDKVFPLAGITHDGELTTDYVNWPPNSFGRVDLAHRYLDDLATLVGGRVQKTKMPAHWYVQGPDGKFPKIDLLFARSEEWLQAIDRYIESLTSALNDE
jgi:hypothetical protein